MSQDRSAEVLKKLRDENAFRALPTCLCRRDLVELRIAEVLAWRLSWFEFYRRLDAGVEYFRSWGKANLRAARALKRYSPALAMELAEEGNLFALKSGVKPRPGTSTQLGTNRQLLNELIADLVTVLFHCTRATLKTVVRRALPPILDVFENAYADVVPRRGFRNPETRLKRYVCYLKTADSLPLPSSQIPADAIRTHLLILFRAIALFGRDRRFPSDLFRRHRTPQRMRRRLGTNTEF